MSGTAIQIVRLAKTLPDDFDALRQEAASEGYAFLDRLATEFANGDYAGGTLRFSSRLLSRAGWQPSAA